LRISRDAQDPTVSFFSVLNARLSLRPKKKNALQDDNRLANCNLANLGDVNAIHYSRITAVRTLTNTGIQVSGLSGCGGNSGGTVMDENACVLFGVLSASAISCTGAGTSSNFYSRIVASAAEVGVPFLSLTAGLVSGQVVFVN